MVILQQHNYQKIYTLESHVNNTFVIIETENLFQKGQNKWTPNQIYEAFITTEKFESRAIIQIHSSKFYGDWLTLI